MCALIGIKGRVDPVFSYLDVKPFGYNYWLVIIASLLSLDPSKAVVCFVHSSWKSCGCHTLYVCVSACSGGSAVPRVLLVYVLRDSSFRLVKYLPHHFVLAELITYQTGPGLKSLHPPTAYLDARLCDTLL